MARSFKKQAEQRFSIAHDNAVELMRQREYDMKISRWQEFRLFVFQPLLPFHATTTWAMSVATVVILVMLMSTIIIIATQQVNTRVGRPAVGQLFEYGTTVGILSLP